MSTTVKRAEAIRQIEQSDEILGELYQYFERGKPADTLGMEWLDVANRALRNAISAFEGRPVASPKTVFKAEYR